MTSSDGNPPPVSNTVCSPASRIEFSISRFAFLPSLRCASVYTSILNESLNRQSRDFTPDGIKARQNNSFRRIVDDEVNACQLLDSSNITTFRPIIRPFISSLGAKRRDGRLRDVVMRIALNVLTTSSRAAFAHPRIFFDF